MLTALITTSDANHLGAELLQDNEDGLHRIERVLATVLRSPVDEVIVIAGHRQQEMREMLASRPCKVVVDRFWYMGDITWSIRAGLPHVSPKAEAVLVCSGADAGLSVEDVDTLVRRYRFMGDEHLYHTVRAPDTPPLLLLPRRFWPDFVRIRPAVSLYQYLRNQVTVLENVVLL